MTKTIKTVGIVGGGFMGSGIAETLAVAGVSVVIRERAEYLVASRERIEVSLARALKRGKLDAAQRDAALELVTLTSELDDLADVDLVIEAVPEVVELKTSIMRALDAILADDTIISSNTSAIPIAQLAGEVRNPSRVVGLHFFSPVPVMALVEIVRALDTSDETVETMRTFITEIGKQSIETKDRSGFIVNFLLIPYLMSAVRMYEEGFASLEDIDQGMKLGAGHPMGPLTLCDFIGLDVVQAVGNSLFEEFKKADYAPPPLMRRMIAAGRLGRKSGRGFYDYS